MGLKRNNKNAKDNSWQGELSSPDCSGAIEGFWGNITANWLSNAFISDPNSNDQESVQAQ